MKAKSDLVIIMKNDVIYMYKAIGGISLLLDCIFFVIEYAYQIKALVYSTYKWQKRNFKHSNLFYDEKAFLDILVVPCLKKSLSEWKRRCFPSWRCFFRFLFFAFLVKHFELKQGRRELLKLIQVENTSRYNLFYASTSLRIVRKLAAAASHNSTFSMMNV